MKKVRSFDLFDTLVARFHYFPHSIFQLVEEKFPFPGFTFLRMGAEKISDGTLDGIYRKFQEITGVSSEAANALKEFEFQTELSQLFPINETITQIKEGDLVVSDTYYSKIQIEQILQKMGICNVRLFATPKGKSSGEIWQRLKEFEIESHLGDSRHSDVKRANKSKIRGVHYKGSALTSREKKVAERDVGLSHLMRALRLQNPYLKGTQESLLWEDQSQLNLPLLIQGCQFLDQFCKAHGKKKLLFTARDCCHWVRLFKVLYPEYESIYFQTCRYTYLYPTPSFIEYVRGLYTDETLIVDLHGKGRTCKMFFDKHQKIEPFYLALYNLKKRHFAICRKRTILESLEMLNYDRVGPLYDVEGGEPKRSAPEVAAAVVEPMHACAQKCLELLSEFKFEPYDKELLEYFLREIKKGVVIERVVVHADSHHHIRDEKGDWSHFHYSKIYGWVHPANNPKN